MRGHAGDVLRSRLTAKTGRAALAKVEQFGKCPDVFVSLYNFLKHAYVKIKTPKYFFTQIFQVQFNSWSGKVG